MYFRVKAWNTFELSFLLSFSIPKKTFSVIKKGKFWFYEDCTELTGILVDFSSFGWTEQSIFIEFFSTGLPHDQTVWTSSWSNVTSGITTRLPPTRDVAVLSCKRQSLTQSEPPFLLLLVACKHGGRWWWMRGRWEARGSLRPGEELHLEMRAGAGKRGREEEWKKESENRSHVKWPLRRRTGTETRCLHREDCL